MNSRLVRIPRELLHIDLDDLIDLGIPASARDALRSLIADLPVLPDATHSAQLIGPPDVTLPSLAVLARHVGQGLRDHNLTLAHDRARLRAERRKLAFLDAETLLVALDQGDERPAHEAVLFVANATPATLPLLVQREANNLASFVAAQAGLAGLAHWRTVLVQ
ncbi:MAG TPA: hypothetical protein VGL99_34575 [Chloroflexota bacterium]